MFLVVNKRRLLILIISIVILCIICVTTYNLLCFVPKREFVVVIDAGHGGSDGGVFGKESGVSEADINLLVAYNLKSVLEEKGIKVVLTRKDKSIFDGEKGSKQGDFEKRKSIILESKPDVVISIHQNKFPDSSRRGAQVFFNKNSEEGKLLASSVQHKLNELNREYVGRNFSALKGDYYILNCSNYPSCIVECGFLSNPQDEKLLLSEDYRKRLSNTIVNGVYDFLMTS